LPDLTTAAQPNAGFASCYKVGVAAVIGLPLESRTHGHGSFPLQHRCTLASSCAACSAFTGSYFLVLIFFVVMAMLLAIFSSLIDYRERGLA
jgi:hypothetical protein